MKRDSNDVNLPEDSGRHGEVPIHKPNGRLGQNPHAVWRGEGQDPVNSAFVTPLIVVEDQEGLLSDFTIVSNPSNCLVLVWDVQKVH